MSTTDNGRDRDAARDGRADWLGMLPTDFDTELPMSQGALFAKPDRLGTPPLFGDLFGTDLS